MSKKPDVGNTSKIKKENQQILYIGSLFAVLDLKSMNIDNIHKIHAQNIQGRVLFEGAEALQAAATQPQRAWGALKSLK